MEDTINLKTFVNETLFAPTTGANFAFPFFIQLAIRLLFIGLILGSFMFLLIGSVQWIMAGGDKDGVEKARKKITGAIVGLAVGFSIYAIIALIGYIAGTDFLNTFTIPSL